MLNCLRSDLFWIYILKHIAFLSCSGLKKGGLNNVLLMLQTMFNVVNNIVQALLHPIAGLMQAQPYCSILLTKENNMGSRTLFNAVFINPEQVVHFLLPFFATFSAAVFRSAVFSCTSLTYYRMVRNLRNFSSFIIVEWTSFAS